MSRARPAMARPSGRQAAGRGSHATGSWHSRRPVAPAPEPESGMPPALRLQTALQGAMTGCALKSSLCRSVAQSVTGSIKRIATVGRRIRSLPAHGLHRRRQFERQPPLWPGPAGDLLEQRSIADPDLTEQWGNMWLHVGEDGRTNQHHIDKYWNALRGGPTDHR